MTHELPTDGRCSQCNKDDGVNRPVIVPTTGGTFSVAMCMECRHKLAEGRL